MKIDCAPLFWGILQPERSVFLHAQTVHLPVLRAVRIHHRVQPVLDGPAQAQPSGARSRQRSTVTGIYTNLLPENDAVRIKRGVTVYSERELDLLLEDLGG